MALSDAVVDFFAAMEPIEFKNITDNAAEERRSMILTGSVADKALS